MAAPHRIRRQSFRVGARSAAEAFDLRRRLAGDLDAVKAAIAAALDELVPGDEVVHLRRLDIRARVASFDELVEVLPELVRREALATLESAGSPVRPVEEAPRRTAAAHRTLEALVHYVRTGSLAWSDETWTRSKNVELFTHLSPAEARTVLESVPTPVVEEATVTMVFRLLQLLPETLWAELANVLPDRLTRTPMSSDASPTVVESELMTEGFATAIAAIVASSLSRHAKLRIVAALVAAARAASAHTAAFALMAMVAQALGTSSSPVDVVEALPRGAQPLFRSIARRFATRSPITRGALADPDRRLRDPPKPAFEIAARPAVTTDRAEEEAEPGLVVSCAGLVLLHPFLVRFFEGVGLDVGSTREIDASKLPRAAALLHHLATGGDEPFEHELGIVKPLLGLSPADPLSAGAGLVTAADREEATRLLEAVVSHWGALGRTSPANLRASFLDRSGILRDRDDGFRLHVESAPYDMLLDRLPWAISVIKLPWMRKPIFTEWPTL